MRDVILALILALVLVATFSLYGPRCIENDGFGGPGLQRPGDTGLIVAGTGTMTVKVVETTHAPETVQEMVHAAKQPTEEEITMDNPTELIWYVAGVVTVLIGEITGPLVAGLWKLVRDKRD